MKYGTPSERKEFFAAHPDIFTTNIKIIEKGLASEFTPPIAHCEFCNAQLETMGAGWQNKVFWRPEPERCTCGKAVKYWQEYDRKEANEQSKADKEREKLQRKADINRLMTQSGLEERFKNRTLENFDATGMDQSIVKAKQSAQYFVDRFQSALEKGRGLYIQGKPGVGKTHLAAGIARAVLEKHRCPVMILTMVDLLSRLRATFNDKTGEDEAYLMRMLSMVDLLIIDDLGKENPTNWTLERIYQIIDNRYQTGKIMLITTNYSDAVLIRRLSRDGELDTTTAEAIVSRLHEMCASIAMTGKDHRLGK